MKKRVLAILLAISLLLCAAPQLTPTASAAESSITVQDPLRYGWRVLAQMDNADGLLFAYEKLVEGIRDSQSQIVVYDQYHSIAAAELTTVLDAVRSDYPEFFWFGLGCSYYSDSSGCVTKIIPCYTMSGEQLEEAQATIAEIAHLLLTGLEDKSDYEISKLLHDRLAAHMSYQYTENDQTIYGALVEKQAVCAGYAAAYQYLLQQAGIPAWKIDGSSIIPGTSTSIGHSWTLTYLDGNWYHTDVTWDDQGNLGKIYYAYLNVTTAQILQDHAIDAFFSAYLPDCTATSANYFVKTGSLATQFDSEQVINVFDTNSLQARLYVTGDINTFLQDWMNNAISIISVLKVSNATSYGCRTLGREVTLTIGTTPATVSTKAITISTLPEKLMYAGDEALDVSGGKLTLHYSDDTTKQIAMTNNMVSGFDKTVTGQQVLTVTAEGCTEYFTVTNTTAAPETIPGDITGDGQISNDDVVYLLWYTLFPEQYPLSVNADITGDGQIANADVVYLLWHTLFPNEYPL